MRFQETFQARPAFQSEYRILNMEETFARVKSGYSLVRFGDSEFYLMDHNATGPLLRDRELVENLQSIALLGKGGCPSLMIALVNANGSSDDFPSLSDRKWWRQRRIFFTGTMRRYFAPGTYGNAFL